MNNTFNWDNFITIIVSAYWKIREITGQMLPWIKKDYLDYVIGGAGIILIYLLYRVFLSGRKTLQFSLPPPGKVLTPKEKKKYSRIANILAGKGEALKSAELYRIVGEIPRAIEMYKRSGKTIMAAQLAADHNFHETAANLFENSARFLEAAEEWEKAGKPDRAAEDYIKEKSFIKAGEVLSRAKLHDKAGDVYEKGGYLDRAAGEYIKSKNYKKAAELLLRLYLQEKKALDINPNVSKQATDNLKKLALKSANYFELAGDYNRAMEFYEKGGNYSKAAELARSQDLWEKAAEYYQLAGLPLKAAEIYERLGDKNTAAKIRAEVYEKEGDELSAAENYIQSGDILSAAEIFKRHGKYEKAAKLYEKIGDHSIAADMYANTGQFSKAAESYEKSGDFLAAADMYQKANNITKLVEMLIKGNQISQAIAIVVKKGVIDQAAKLLIKIPPDSPEFYEAINLILKAYVERGEWGKIKQLLQKYSKIKVSRSNLDLIYTIAKKFEDEADFTIAYNLYKKFVKSNLLYKDVKNRYELLRAKHETETSKTSTVTQKEPEKGKRRRYQIIRELGRGGMGVVYQAHDTVLDRIVALKVLPLSLRLNPKAVESFKSEAKKAAALNHPNIVIIYDYGEEEGEYFIVMEYINGETLKNYIKRQGKLSLRYVNFIAVNVAKGLAYAHNSNLIHRDIKPSNIMLSLTEKEKRVKIADFGLAKAWQDSIQHQTMIVGTPYYMAPEQFLGEKVDERTDIYSFGITLYEMVTGEVPFKKGEIGYHHVHSPPVPPHEVIPDVNPLLEKIILKCMEKDPEKRFQRMEEILQEFARLKSK